MSKMEPLTSQNHSTNSNGGKGSLLLEMKNIWIEGFSDERWHEIIKGVNLTLNRGEILGLIGSQVQENRLLDWLPWVLPDRAAGSPRGRLFLTGRTLLKRR